MNKPSKKKPGVSKKIAIFIFLLASSAAAFIMLPEEKAVTASVPVEILNSTPQSLPFSQNWSNSGLITTNDDWSGVPGIEGYFLRNDAVSTVGIDPRTILGDNFGAGTTTVELDVLANQIGLPTSTAGGIAEFHPTDQGVPFYAPVVGMQADDTVDAPFLLLNVSTTGRAGINVQYAVYDMDCSADNAVQFVATQYRIGNTGNFANLPGEFIPDVTAGPNLCNQVSIMGGSLPAAVNDKPLVQIRIITTNAAGADEWVGIDFIDVTSSAAVTPTPTPAATPTPTPSPTLTPTPTRTPTPTPTPTPVLPTLSINDVNQIEGNLGTSTFVFVVSRSGPLDGVSSAAFGTFNETATGGFSTAPPIDYITTSGTVNFAPGQDSAPAVVTVVGDVVFEGDETFTVRLADAMGATIVDAVGRGTIINDDFVYINEVDSDTAGTDTMEFIELFATSSPGNIPLDGLVVVLYDGATDTSYAAFDLDGHLTNQSGYFTLGSANVPGVDIVLPADTIQNGADAVALYIGNATDFPSGTPPRLINVGDAIVYDTDDDDDPGLLQLLNLSQPQINENATGNSPIVSMQRCPNGFGGGRNTTPHRLEIPTPDLFNSCPSLTFTISGRVFTPSGQGLRNAIVSLTDAQGTRRTATTSSFGVYGFDNVSAGQTYTLSVSSKRYRFAPKILTANDNLSNVDFIGLE
ncbi:MAG: carboxypeptidase regulatory-like domain-containing protein [Pyrinomonadaceae bacterium]